MKRKLSSPALMLAGLLVALASWATLSATAAPDLPSPAKTWEDSRLYVLAPFAWRSETDQGILALAARSLSRVIQGFAIAILAATPIGFLFGLSGTLRKMFDPLVQMMRPVSPLAWVPLGLVLFASSAPAAVLFTIAMCSMWPTVINTVLGLDSLPASRRATSWDQFRRVTLPATLPFTFAGYRVSFGVAWMVMVAAEVMTKTTGVGGFLYQAWQNHANSLVLLSIIVIGVIGLLLDRLMGVVERKVRSAFANAAPHKVPQISAMEEEVAA